jgi:hypothetical protein
MEISEFRIELQQRVAICKDKSVCAYLAKSLRKAKRGYGTDLSLGFSYSFTFRFVSGDEYCAREACVFDKGFSMSIPEANPPPPEAGWVTHQVDFLDPIPERLREIWKFLRDPHDRVYGSVMIVEDGKHIRVEYDRQLDLEGRNAH